MKRMIIAILLSVLALSSCRKDQVPTQAQLTARKLIAALGGATGFGAVNGRSFYVNDAQGQSSYINANYEITSDGFISLGQASQVSKVYNLTFLTSYYISGGQIDLYFNF